MSKEFSAIDAIHQILSELKEIKQQIIVIDNNIKILNNKFNTIDVTKNKNPRAVIKPGDDNTPIPSQESDKLVKVFSKVKNAGKKPIKDVYITIFDPKGNTVKTRTTDSEGYWEARIPPGQYVVEINPQHINKKFNPININININENMHEFEVRNTS
jgi:NADH:ubiquinone oxidoreductase subunit D